MGYERAAKEQEDASVASIQDILKNNSGVKFDQWEVTKQKVDTECAKHLETCRSRRDEMDEEIKRWQEKERERAERAEKDQEDASVASIQDILKNNSGVKLDQWEVTKQ